MGRRTDRRPNPSETGGVPPPPFWMGLEADQAHLKAENRGLPAPSGVHICPTENVTRRSIPLTIYFCVSVVPVSLVSRSRAEPPLLPCMSQATPGTFYPKPGWDGVACYIFSGLDLHSSRSRRSPFLGCPNGFQTRSELWGRSPLLFWIGLEADRARLNINVDDCRLQPGCKYSPPKL